MSGRVEPPAAPLCDAGRCAQILASLAEARSMERLGEQYGAALVDILAGVLSEYGLDPAREDVRAAVDRRIAAVTGVAGGDASG